VGYSNAAIRHFFRALCGRNDHIKTKERNPLNSSERQAHAAHREFQKSSTVAQGNAAVAGGPSAFLDPDSPEVVVQLESLDDAVFDAIHGEPAAMAELRDLWPRLKSRLGDALLAESREQYIRYALNVWREPVGCHGSHDPRRAVYALEVLCVLFDEI